MHNNGLDADLRAVEKLKKGGRLGLGFYYLI